MKNLDLKLEELEGSLHFSMAYILLGIILGIFITINFKKKLKKCKSVCLTRKELSRVMKIF